MWSYYTLLRFAPCANGLQSQCWFKVKVKAVVELCDLHRPEAFKLGHMYQWIKD